MYAAFIGFEPIREYLRIEDTRSDFPAKVVKRRLLEIKSGKRTCVQ